MGSFTRLQERLPPGACAVAPCRCLDGGTAPRPLAPRPPTSRISSPAGPDRRGREDGVPTPDLFGPECRQVSRWNPGTSAYEEPATLQPGEGCWVRMAANATVTITGETLETQELALAQGWNQVGNPFTVNLPWAGGAGGTWCRHHGPGSAQAAGWLDSVLVFNGRRYAKPDLATGGLVLGGAAWVRAAVEGVQLRFTAQAPKRWTVMLYLDGENGDIQTDLLKEFEFMVQRRVGSDANVNVVAELDRIPGSDLFGGWTEAQRFYVTPGMEPTTANAIADWGDGTEAGSSTPPAAHLRDFLTWAARSLSRRALRADRGRSRLWLERPVCGRDQPWRDHVRQSTWPRRCRGCPCT